MVAALFFLNAWIEVTQYLLKNKKNKNLIFASWEKDKFIEMASRTLKIKHKLLLIKIHVSNKVSIKLSFTRIYLLQENTAHNKKKLSYTSI